MPDEEDPSAEQGHRLLPHTADVIVEAWGPDRSACLRQAVLGLVSSFADTTALTALTALAGVAGPSDRPATVEVPYTVAPGDDASLLVGLLDEVIYLLDARGVVPVEVTVAGDGAGGLTGAFTTVPARAVEAEGAVPKAIAWHGVAIGPGDGGWRCRVTVDV